MVDERQGKEGLSYWMLYEEVHMERVLYVFSFSMFY